MAHLNRSTRLSVAFLSSVCGLAIATSAAWSLETFTLDNVVLDNGEKGKTTIARVEFVGTNLTKEEAQRLFSLSVSRDDATGILSKLVASRVTIPQIVMSGKDGQMSATGLQATDIDTGKVGHFALGGFEGDVPGEGGRVTMKSGPIAVDGAGLMGVFSALKAGDMGGATSHFGHLSWQGFEMTAPDKDTPAATPGGNLYKFSIGSLTADGTADGDVPLKTSGNLKNLVVTPPPGSQTGQSLAAFGVTSIDLGMSFASTYDPAQKTFALEDLTLAGANLGSLALKLQLTGIDKTAFTGGSSDARLGSVMGGGVSAVEIRFADAGVAAKALAFAAQSQGAPPDAFKAQAAAMATQMIPALLGGHPSSTQIADQVSKFIADPKALVISARPKDGSLAFMDAFGLMDPTAFLAKVDVAVVANPAGGASPTAAASGAQAPAIPPAAALAPRAPAPPAAAPRPQTQAAVNPPAAPRAPARLTGLAAWNALVGNSISGKNEDGDPVTEFYLRNGTVKQMTDDEIETGKWAARGDKICFEYPDDDEESCYTVVLDGNVATFTDEDGSGRRYEVLQGNPKKL